MRSPSLPPSRGAAHHDRRWYSAERCAEGRRTQARTSSFTRNGETVELSPKPRVVVNDGATISRLVLDGAGIGIISGFVCAPEISAGRLVHLLPEWSAPAVDVHLMFPSKRELAPAVRALSTS